MRPENATRLAEAMEEIESKSKEVKMAALESLEPEQQKNQPQTLHSENK